MLDVAGELLGPVSRAPYDQAVPAGALAAVGADPVHVQVLPAHPPAGGLDAEEPAGVHGAVLALAPVAICS